MDANGLYNELLAKKLIEEFNQRGFECFYSLTKEDALSKLLSLIPKGSSVSFGGSQTLKEIGAKDAVKNGDYHLLDASTGVGAIEKERIAREALTADYFLMSSNAITQSGELVNADGIGNRVAALIFGAKHVIVVAGINKVEPTLEAAIARIKTSTAQKAVMQYNQNFSSFDNLYKAGEAAISQLVVTSKSVMKGRVKIILVGEDLGI